MIFTSGSSVSAVFNPDIIPITVAILLGLFLIQRHGTARVESIFEPESKRVRTALVSFRLKALFKGR